MRASHVSFLNGWGRTRSSYWLPAIALSMGLTGGAVLQAAEDPGHGQPGHVHVEAAPVAQAAATATKPAGPVGKIACDETSHEFGEVWSGDKVEHTFTIKNTGEGVLEISRVQPSCGCTLAGDFDRTIAPGKTGKVPVALKTDGQRGPVTKTITVYSNDTTQPTFMLHLKGTVKTAIDMQPLTGFSWAQITPQSPETITITLTNNVNEPWNLALKPDPGQEAQQSAFEVALKEIEKNKKAEVTAKIKKPLREGSVVTQFTIATGLTKQPELKISANYYLPPALQVMPASLTGFSTPGQEYRSMLTVAYTREGTMKILEVVPSDAAIQTEVKDAAGGDNKRYTIGVTLPKDFNSPLEKPATIQIKTDRTELANNGVLTVPIHVRPQVITPAPQQMVGKPSPITTVKAPAGGEMKIGGPGDSITVVNFWATWCGFCKRQAPMLAELYKEYSSKGVKFINVSVDSQKSPSEVEQFARQLESPLPVALDVSGQMATTKWNAKGWPSLFILNKQGVIEAFHSGAPPTLTKDIKSELDLLLAGKSVPRPPVAAAATQPAARVVEAPPSVTGPSLFIESLRQDLGQRKPGETAQYSLQIRNNGSEAVQIKEIKPGSGAVKADAGSPTTLAPGASGVIKLEISTPRKPGAFEESITIQSTDPSRPQQTVTLAGKVRNYVEVQTQRPDGVISFPPNPRVQDIPSLATLVYNGEGKIEYGKPESSSSKFEASIEPIPNGPYSKLIVKARPPLDQGDNDAVIHIKTSCKEQPELDVPVKFYLPPRVEVSPREVLLDPTGRLQRSMVVIKNNGQKPLSILGVTRSSERITWQFYPESDGLSYKLMVTVPPADAGETGSASEKLTIRTDDPEFGEIIIPIKFKIADAGAAGPAAAAR